MLDAILNSQNIGYTLLIILQQLIIVVISLTVHEVAHGWAAKKLGDSTAANFGRLSLNPLKHLDPWGFICMMVAGFGWAKPVPIRTRNFKHPRRDMALSALAGPASNLLLAVLMMIPCELLVLLVNNGTIVITSEFAFNIFSVVLNFLFMFHYLNISLAVFNFIPIPPLDGSRILYSFLPDKLYFGVMKYEQTISMIIMVLIVTGVLDKPLGIAVNAVSYAVEFIIPIIR